MKRALVILFFYCLIFQVNAQNTYLQEHIPELKKELTALNIFNDSLWIHASLFGKQLDSLAITQQYRFKNGMVEKNEYVASIYDFRDDEFTKNTFKLTFYKNKLYHIFSEYNGEIVLKDAISTMQFYTTKNKKQLTALRKILFSIREKNARVRALLREKLHNRY